MKKSVSFLLALMAVATVNLNSFAMENSVNTQENAVSEEILLENDNKTSKFVLSLGKTDNEIELSSLLTPNQTLRFPILVTDENSKTEQFNSELSDEFRVKIETKLGKNAVNSIKIVEDNKLYYLEIKTVLGYPTEQFDYEGSMKITSKTTGETLGTMNVSFKTGYEKVSDEAIEAAKNGAYLFIDDKNPVITAEQFSEIDKAVNGDKIIITNGHWAYEVRVNGQTSVNLHNNQKSIKEILTKFENQDFRFVNFPAGPAFDFTGKLTIDVSEFLEENDEIFVYSYYNNKLNKVFATINYDEGTASFDTKYFGRFVITNEEIKNGTFVEDCQNDCEETVTPSNPSKPNPETGIAGIEKMAALMSTISASILGIFAVKKDKK